MQFTKTTMQLKIQWVYLCFFYTVLASIPNLESVFDETCKTLLSFTRYRGHKVRLPAGDVGVYANEQSGDVYTQNTRDYQQT